MNLLLVVLLRWLTAFLLPFASRKYSLILFQLGSIITFLMERSHHIVLSTPSTFETSVKTLIRNILMPFRLCSHVFWFLSFWLFPLPVFSAWLNLMYSMLCSLKCLAWMLLCLMRNHLSYEVILTSKRTLGQKWEYLPSTGYTDLGCASLLESTGLPEKCAIPSLNCYQEQCLNKYVRLLFYFTLCFWSLQRDPCSVNLLSVHGLIILLDQH